MSLKMQIAVQEYFNTTFIVFFSDVLKLGLTKKFTWWSSEIFILITLKTYIGSILMYSLFYSSVLL